MSRAQNVSMDERLLLISLFQDKAQILLDKRTDGRLVPVKAQAWEDITNSMNSAGLGPERNVKQIKKIWENMKGRAKKVAAEQRKEVFRTGGGIPDFPKSDPTTERILAIISDELLPPEFHLDSDRPEHSADAQIIDFDNEGNEVATETVQVYSTLEGEDELEEIIPFSRPSSAPPNPGQSEPLTPSSRPSSAPPPATPSCSTKRPKRKRKFDGPTDVYGQVADHQKHEHQLIMKINEKKLELIEANLEAKRKENENKATEHELIMKINQKKLELIEVELKAKQAEIEIQEKKRKLCDTAYNVLEDWRMAASSVIEAAEHFKQIKK